MANNGLPPGATLVSGSLPSQSADVSAPDTSVSQSSTPRLPPGATLVSGAVPPPSSPSFPSEVGTGLGEAVRDIYGVGKGMVPGGPAETGTLKTIWNNLPPVQLADSVKQILPLVNAYEQKRASGASISDSLNAVNETAKQHMSNITNIKPVVDAFRENPTRETARALTDAAALAASMFVGGEATAPEEAATAAKVVPAAEAVEAAKSPSWFLRYNPFRTKIEARTAATQPIAAPAVRTAVGVEPGTPILAGSKTVLDEPLADLATKKSAAYKQIDDTVGFDLKAEREHLADTQYAIKQPGADKAGLQSEIDESTQRIAAANQKLTAAKIDPKVADSLNTSWEAGKQFKQVLVRSTNPDGTIKIDSLLNGSKNLRFNPKYGDRLAQMFGQGDVAAGKPIADEFMTQLQAAQKAGLSAVKANRLAKWVGGTLVGGIGLGAVAEGIKHIFFGD